MPTRVKFILILLSIILFLIGTIFFSQFITWFLIKEDGVKYSVSGISDQFKYMMLFSLVIAAIPITPIFLQLRNIKSILITCSILIAAIIIAVIIKKLLLLYNIKKFSVVIPGEDIQMNLPLSNFIPVYYMLIALLTAILTLSILKSQKFIFKEESK